MPQPQGDKLIFGRFTREECGLPPLAERAGTRWSFLVRAVVLLAVLIAAGWLGGSLAARWRETWIAGLPYRIARAEPEEISGLLTRGGLYAAALADRPETGRDMAYAVLLAAERAPRRMGYYGNLTAMFDRKPNGDETAVSFRDHLAAAGLYADRGRYPDAFARLKQAEKALDAVADEKLRRSLNLLLVNAQAYFLAEAPREQGGNPERALHLAQLLITSRDELPGGGYASGSPAFLDTIAMAWAAVGKRDKAAEIQSFALGLAEAADLDVYLRHYDAFTRPVEKEPAGKR